MERNQVIRSLVTVAAGAVLLTACGGTSSTASKTTSPPAKVTSSSAPASTAPTTTESSAGTSSTVDVCKVVPAATAAQLSGQAITTADTQTNTQPGVSGCDYSNDDSSVQVEISIFKNGASTYDAARSGSANASDVSRLGDKAFYDGEGTLYVQVGSNVVQVNGVQSSEKSAALARPVVEAL